MDIGPIAPIPTSLAAVRPSVAVPDPAQTHRQVADTDAKLAEASRRRARDPLPAIRPTIQDRIDITQALLTIRGAQAR